MVVRWNECYLNGKAGDFDAENERSVVDTTEGKYFPLFIRSDLELGSWVLVISI